MQLVKDCRCHFCQRYTPEHDTNFSFGCTTLKRWSLVLGFRYRQGSLLRMVPIQHQTGKGQQRTSWLSLIVHLYRFFGSWCLASSGFSSCHEHLPYLRCLFLKKSVAYDRFGIRSPWDGGLMRRQQSLRIDQLEAVWKAMCSF